MHKMAQCTYWCTLHLLVYRLHCFQWHNASTGVHGHIALAFRWHNASTGVHCYNTLVDTMHLPVYMLTSNQMAKSQRIYWCTWLLCIRWHNESTDFLNRIFLDTRWPTIVHSYIALDGTMHLLAHMVLGLSLGFFVWGECSPPPHGKIHLLV